MYHECPGEDVWTLDYIELLSCPWSVGKYLEIELLSIEKHGSDVPATQNPRMYHVAISEDTTLTEAEVAAGNSQTYTFVDVPTWPDTETRYVFVGVPDDRPDIIGINVATAEEPEDFFTRVFERVPGTVNDANGVPVKWWRTTLAYDSPGDVFEGSTYVSGWTSATTPIVEDIIRLRMAGRNLRPRQLTRLAYTCLWE